MRAADVFSHITAAHLWGMPLPLSLASPTLLHVAAVAPRRAVEGRGVRGHQLALVPDEVRVVDGLRVTDPSLTWCLLASILALEDLIAVGDFVITALPGTQPLGSLSSLKRAVAARPRLRGVVALRAALPLLRVGVRSRPESLFRVAIIQAGLPEPMVNRTIHDRRGRFLAMPDLSWPDFRVAAEYEGDYHRVERGQFHHDIGRIERMTDEQWSVLRVSAPALFDETHDLVARVARRLSERGWSPSRPIDMSRIGHLRR